MNAVDSARRWGAVSITLLALACAGEDATPPDPAAAAAPRIDIPPAEATTATSEDHATDDTPCALLAASSTRRVGVSTVLATHCPAVTLSARDLQHLVLDARTPARARALLSERGAWGDNELSRLVSLLLAVETLAPPQSPGEATLTAPPADQIAVIPMGDEDVELARALYAQTNSPDASASQKTRAQAALATIFLQVFDSLGVRDTTPMPPLARLLAARFLVHARAFAVAHLRERVPGLHPFLMRLEPEMAAIVRLLANTSMGASDGLLASAWLSGYRYLRIGEVAARLGAKAKIPWRLATRCLIDLRMPRHARAVLASEFPVAARRGVLDRWLREVAGLGALAPPLTALGGGPQPTIDGADDPLESMILPEALEEFHTQLQRDRRAVAERIEADLITGTRSHTLGAAVAWAEHEAILLDDPEILRRLIERTRTTAALRPYRAPLLDAAHRSSLRPELYREARQMLGAAGEATP